MILAFTILSIILSELIGYNIQRLSYGQPNITRDNLTNSNMMVGTDTDNKGSVSGGLAVSDEGASGKKIVRSKVPARESNFREKLL
jgi:hypothetical protein